MVNGLKLLMVSLFIGGMMNSFASQANNQCHYNSGVTAKTTTLSLGTIVIPRDHPIGTTIKEILIDHVDNQGDIAYCDRPTQASWDEPAFDRAHYNYDAIYESGVPGVGIRINTWGPGYGIDWLPRVVEYPLSCYPSRQSQYRTQYCGKTWGYITVQLIKIAPTTGSGQVGNQLLTRARLGSDISIHSFYLTNTRIITQGCSFKQNTTIVDMGNVKISEFRGVNSTAGVRDFNLQLDCDANLDVEVTLDGRPAKNHSNDTWALDYNRDNVMATGIGLQILFGNRPLLVHLPLKFRSSQYIRNFSIPLRARYIQTEPRVTPGKADVTITMSLTYQ